MGIGSGGGGGGRAPLSEINVTPLVDVMLVLLVIFMVTAPLMTAGVEVDLRQADAPDMQLEEVQMQQYIISCYGSLTTFNVLFRTKEEGFTGQSGKD